MPSSLRRLAAPLLAAAAVALLPVPPASAQGDAEDGDLGALSIEELMNVKVVSPSRTAEALAAAPATVVVVTRREIAERGYGDLSELLDDLPGMQMVRPRGDTLFKNYWRGFRNTIGTPYLLLLDGVVLNHLYFNTDDVMLALPLSNVERVEVVYGPASAVYGPNAFTGVIQVFTGRGGGRQAADGAPASPATSGGRLRVEAGENERRIFDGSWTQVLGAAGEPGRWSLSLTARGADGDLDDHGAEGYAYTDPALLGDPRLWGGFADDGRLAGELTSPERHRAADLRLFRSPGKGADEGGGGPGVEVALQYLATESGYGYEYAFDSAAPSGLWRRADWSGYLRLRHELSPRLSSTSLLRYRRSTVDDDSYFVEGYPDAAGHRVVDYSRWKTDNDSWAAFEDLELRWSDRLVLLGGIKLERKDLQKEYETAYGPSLPPGQVSLATYPFPSGDDVYGPPNNRVTTDDVGVYGEAKWAATADQHLHLGVRYDDNSEYGGAVTVRAGYAGTFGRWGLKALFGEGFQEPNQRVLYGGWQGSGSNPTLDPERSRTWEGSVSHARERTRQLASVWLMENRDTIVNTGSGEGTPATAQNLGTREVSGLDYHFEALPPVKGLDSLRLWAYWSHLFHAEEERFDAAGRELPEGPIGDLADDQVWLGVTAVRQRLSANLRGRWIGSRETVASNPVGEVGSFATADLYVRYRLPASGRLDRLGPAVGLRVTNLFDERYYHPGIREASAGVDPGFFDAAGDWHGAGGFYNSLIPQPGRQVGLVVTLGGG